MGRMEHIEWWVPSDQQMGWQGMNWPIPTTLPELADLTNKVWLRAAFYGGKDEKITNARTCLTGFVAGFGASQIVHTVRNSIALLGRMELALLLEDLREDEEASEFLVEGEDSSSQEVVREVPKVMRSFIMRQLKIIDPELYNFIQCKYEGMGAS